MKNTWLLLITALLLGTSVGAGEIAKGEFGAGKAQVTEKPKAPSGSKEKRKSYPFSGELESFDSTTITLKGKQKPRIVRVTAQTRVRKDGSAVTLKEASTGERVSGSVMKDPDGKEVALTINLKGAALKKIE